MAKVPTITSPCPLRWSSMPRTGADFCGKCERRVHNLDGMSEDQRRAFFRSCSGEVCVAYTVRVPIGATVALRLGAAAATLAVAGGAFASDGLEQAAPSTQAASFADVTTGPACDPAGRSLETIVLAGGTDSALVEWIDESELALPDRPVIADIAATDWLPTPTTPKR